MNKIELELRKKSPVQIKNKKASFDYFFVDTYTAGIVLTGTEIKSIRLGKASLVDTFCYINNGEIWVKGMNINPYFYGSYNNHEAKRDRKLLLNKREIRRLQEDTKAVGFTIVPTLVFIDDKGRAKVDIALCRGKKEFDKRQTIKEKQDALSSAGADVEKLLRDIVFSASRMLLVTRGADPRTDDEVYSSFEELFIDAGIVDAAFKTIVEKARHSEPLTADKAQVEALAAKVNELYASMDDSLQFKAVIPVEQKKEELSQAEARIDSADVKKDFRGVACPMNFVKTKIQLSTMQSGQLLEILLDDGQPIQNVPGSVRQEGHEVLSTEKVDNYWKVLIKKK